MAGDFNDLIQSLEKQQEATDRQVESRHNENIQKFGMLEANVKHLDDKIDDIDRKLFGNGQPGILAVMDTKITELEKWMWRTAGMLAAGFGILSFVLAILEIIYKR